MSKTGHVSLAGSMASAMASMAASAPPEIMPVLLHRAGAWARHAKQIASSVVIPEDCEKATAELTSHYAGNGVTSSQAQPAAIFRWKFDGAELLHEPPGFREGVAAARSIRLEFESACGGDGDVALGMVDVLRESKLPVHTHVTSFACSAHAYMFVLAGTKRTMVSTAKLMLHGASIAVLLSLRSSPGYVDKLTALSKRIIDLLVERGVPAADAARFLNCPDRWLTAAECLKLGLADSICPDGLVRL